MGNTKKKLLIIVAVLGILLVSIGLSAQIALAEAHPLRPGHAIFPLQDFAEQGRAKLTIREAQQTAYLLELAAKRTEDLLILAGSEDGPLAAEYLVQVLDQLIYALGEAAIGESALPLDDLVNLVLNIRVMLEDVQFRSAAQIEGTAQLEAKVLVLEEIISNLPGMEHGILQADLDQIVAAGSLLESRDGVRGTEVSPHSIQFPPGSPGAEHAFFTLEGSHEELDCLDCHTDGEYAGTANACIDCHLERLPEAHYGEDCAGCHNAFSWQDVIFDHALLETADCQSCHLDDTPGTHYAAQCSTCHNFEGWEQVNFEHQAVDTKDCQSCHTNDRPDMHYQAQCSACHNTTNWTQANFNHQAIGAKDCLACHGGLKPANHYGGQCSACHNTSNWSQANFNHQAVGATDCLACHSGLKPANHYGGQCSACHNTNNWSKVSFDHQAAGATDCKACHSGRKPANHFGGQCSACHNTTKWTGAKFNHSAAGATDCKACHSGNKPANHFDGQCSKCHTTSSWSGASFNHKFPVNHGGANGKCAQCHPSGGSQYNCFACHDQAKMTNKHNEEGISNFSGRCLDCHPNGREGGGDGGGDGGGGEDDDD